MCMEVKACVWMEVHVAGDEGVHGNKGILWMDDCMYIWISGEGGLRHVWMKCVPMKTCAW